MKTLVLDASYQQKVALLENGQIIKMIESESVKADRFMELIDTLLKDCCCDIDSIDEICVNIGPGSFTGIRVAVSIAKGLGITKNIKFKTFNSFDYFKNGLNVVLVGFSDFVYLKTSNGTMDCVNVNDLDSNQSYVVSDSALAEKMKQIGLLTTLEPMLAYNEIDAIVNGKNVTISEIRPLYLRKSQAEIQRENKLSGGR